jgi:predicted MFS family arabinose efflux permease
VVGAWLLARFVPHEARVRVTGVLAALAGLALVLCAFQPGLWSAIAILLLSGIFTAYQVQVGATFGRSTPADSRAQVMGLLNSGVLTAQGIGVLLAGVLAEGIGVANTVAVAGALGAVIAVPAAAAWYRSAAAQPAAGR